MLTLRRLSAISCVLVTLAACGGGGSGGGGSGGGGSGGGGSTSSAPSGLSYSQNMEAAVAVAYSISPSVTGSVNAYTVSPALPPGLSINASSGVIAGTPTAMTPLTNYTVTASNDSGSTTATVSIQVRDTYVSYCISNCPPQSNPYSALLQVTATSYYGVASVSVSVGGKFIGALTTTPYNFNLAGLFVSGTYPLIVTTVTNSGVTETYTSSITIDNPPVVTTSLVAGTYVYGSLTISGTATSDKPGPVSVTVDLNETTVQTTTEGPWSATFNLSGVPSGPARIYIAATDSGGASASLVTGVAVTTNPAEAALVPLIFATNILAVDGNDYLYADTVGNVHFSSAAGDVVLQSVAVGGEWQISNGLPYAYSTEQGYASVYTFSATTGAATNLSALVGETNDNLIAVHDGWILWWNQSSQSLELFNLSSRQLTVLPTVAPLEYGLDGNFYISGGEVQVLYTAFSGSSSQIYQWSQATGAVSPVSAGAGGGGVSTDGVYAVWSTAGSDLVAYNISTATITVLSTSAPAIANHTLANGYVAWLEEGSSSPTVTIKVWSEATGVSQVVSYENKEQFLVGDGYVLFWDTFGLEAFNVAKGTTSLVVDTAEAALNSGNTIYFAPLNSSNPIALNGSYWYREVLP